MLWSDGKPVTTPIAIGLHSTDSHNTYRAVFMHKSLGHAFVCTFAFATFVL